MPFELEKDLGKLLGMAERLSSSLEGSPPASKELASLLEAGVRELSSKLSASCSLKMDVALQSYELAPMGCVLIDSKGVVSDANAKFSEMCGRPLPSILSRPFADFVAPETRDAFYRRCVVLFSGLSPETPCEVKLLKADGERFYAGIKGIPVSALGSRMCLLFVFDINANKAISLALAESERRFRMLFEQNPLGYLALNSAGSVSEMNEAAIAMFSLSREGLLGKPLASIVASPSLDAFSSLLSSLRRDGHALQTEIEFLRPDASSFIASVNGNVGVDSHGMFTQTHLILADVSAARRADAERRLLAAAIGQASECVLVISMDGSVVYANPAFEKASGSPKYAILGQRLGFFFEERPAVQEPFHARIPKLLDSSGSWSGRVVGRRASSSVYEAEIAVSCVRGLDGELLNYIVVAQDITERLKMERELRQSQKMQAIGTLAGGIAHDFNNILMAMMGYTEMALEASQDNQRSRVFLHQVLTSSQRARDLIRQILTFSRQTERSLRPLQAGLVVKEAMKLLRSTLPSTIKMKSSIRSRSLCLADLTEMHQIVMNLCANAAHSMSELGGCVELSLEDVELSLEEAAAKRRELRPGKFLLLVVKDNGCGIQPEDLGKIFDPFFTTKPAGEGTGMGLSVVQGIVKELKGHVEVESSPGKGSAFRIYIPAVGSDARLEVEDLPEKLLGQGQTVLCVDDEPAILELFSEMLGGLGYKPVLAASAVQALAMVAESPKSFDAVISDQAMPEMTGLRLAREILKIRPDLPVLLCTGFSGSLVHGEASRSGVKDVLFKPVTGSDLGFALRKLFPLSKGG